MKFFYATILTAVLCAGQTPPVQFKGIVLDPAHSPISGAQISITPGRQSGLTTTPSGEFTLQTAPGNYTVTVSKDGFTSLSRSLDLPQQSTAPAIFQLDVSPVQSTVTVIENADYLTTATRSATKTLTPLLDVPQSITVVTGEQIKDQMMMSIGDVVRYVPGISAHQGENNRDQLVIRGNSTSADFFVDGVRDDVQYYRDLYNLEKYRLRHLHLSAGIALPRFRQSRHRQESPGASGPGVRRRHSLHAALQTLGTAALSGAKRGHV